MKAMVLSIVQTMSSGQADPNLADRYYRDIVYDLGKKPLLTNASLVATSVGTATYSYPANAITLLDVYWDDAKLDPIALREIEALDPEWRNRKGAPVGYVVEEETAATFRLYPVPDRPSQAVIPTHGAPFGLDYPGEGLVVVHTETRTDLPDWLDMPIALMILDLEFSRESNHRDPLMAIICREVAAMLMRFVGVG